MPINEKLVANVIFANQSVGSATLNINDTSTENYSIYFSSDSGGSNQVSAIKEGSTIFLQVRTQGIPNGTNLAIAYSGSTAWSPALPTSVTISGGSATVSSKSTLDIFNKPNVSVTATLKKTSGAVASSATLTVTENGQMNATFVNWKNINGIVVDGLVGAHAFETAIFAGEQYNVTFQTTNIPTGTQLSLTEPSGAGNLVSVPTGGVVQSNGMVTFQMRMGWLSGNYIDASASLSFNGGTIAALNWRISYKADRTTLGKPGAPFPARMFHVSQSSIMLHPGEWMEVELTGGGGATGSSGKPNAQLSDFLAINGTHPALEIWDANVNLTTLALVGGGFGALAPESDVSINRIASGNVWTYKNLFNITVTTLVSTNGNRPNGKTGGTSVYAGTTGVIGLGAGATNTASAGSMYGGQSGGYARVRVGYAITSAGASHTLGPITIAVSSLFGAQLPDGYVLGGRAVAYNDGRDGAVGRVTVLNSGKL